MSQTFFSNSPNPLLSDLDADLSQLFASVSIATNTSQITVAAGNDGNGNNTLAWSLASSLTVQTLTANTQLIGKGTTTNDNASAGYIGEAPEYSVTAANAVASGSGNVTAVLSFNLPAGDYDAGGVVAFTGNATAVVYLGGGLTTTAGSLPDAGNRVQHLGAGGNLTVDALYALPSTRLSIPNGGATVYLNIKGSFGAGTLKGYGRVGLRRER